MVFRVPVLPSLLFMLNIIMGSPAHSQTAHKPNIIWIVADDLGYSDLPSYGNKDLQTPNIDALLQQGARFTQAYATAPICAPSREGMITGRYQQRFGGEFMPYEEFDPGYVRNIRRHFLAIKKENPGFKDLKRHHDANAKNYSSGLQKNEMTIAQLLKGNGYATGIVGKWNEGGGEGDYPDQRGYDYSYFFEGALTRYVDDPVDATRYVSQPLPHAFSNIPAWAPRYGSTAIIEERKVVKDTGYSSFSFAQKANSFIATHKSEPFFLTVAFNAPHDPFQAPKEYIERVKGVDDPVKRIYYAMIMAMDDAIGMIRQQLKAEGLENNTVIFFISDNGGAAYTAATDNAPLRGGKCTHFEGGLKVPFIIHYPGIWKNDKAIVYDKPVSILDMFVSSAAISGTTLPTDREFDGVNLLPYVDGTKREPPHEILFWRNGYSKAIRKGEWKAYVNGKSKKTFLFDLSKDPTESTDLSKQQPAKLKELLDDLHNWEKQKTVAPAWRSAADIRIVVNGKVFYFPA
jgi:arylsulfatase A-like enzyme